MKWKAICSTVLLLFFTPQFIGFGLGLARGFATASVIDVDRIDQIMLAFILLQKVAIYGLIFLIYTWFLRKLDDQLILHLAIVFTLTELSFLLFEFAFEGGSLRMITPMWLLYAGVRAAIAYGAYIWVVRKRASEIIREP